jgi:hypothetical protein
MILVESLRDDAAVLGPFYGATWHALFREPGRRPDVLADRGGHRPSVIVAVFGWLALPASASA